jgi:peptidoglycan/xylan/chitin deacetylase (PgdA/CDA1 family)
MLTVSNYHYIRTDFNAKFPSIFGMTPAQFDQQLLLLKNHGTFVSPNDLTNHFSEILKSEENHILITFDDGLREQYDHALPILDHHNIPAIFFASSINTEHKKVNTVHKIHLLRSILAPAQVMHKLSENKINPLEISERSHAHSVYRYDDPLTAELKYLLNFRMPFDLQERIMGKIFTDYFDESEINEKLYMDNKNLVHLAERGYLGSHTHNHYPLGLLPKKQICFELEHSKSYFEQLTNMPINMVSYPYGTDDACTPEVAEIAAEAQYTLGFTTNRGVNTTEDNPLLLKRFDCNDLPGGKSYKS